MFKTHLFAKRPLALSASAAGVLLTAFLFSGCISRSNIPQKYIEEYDQPSFWYQTTGNTGKAYDVFYVLPTCVWDFEDSQGNVHHLADPTIESQRESMRPSYELAESIFSQEANFFAPYYHQATLDVWKWDEKSREPYLREAMDEVLASFDYYMERWNQGRPFVIAGFSQGGMGVVELLRHMDDKTYDKLIGAYAIGYRITKEDTLFVAKGQAKRHVIPAKGPQDAGVTISYNTVLDPATYENGDLGRSLLHSVTDDAAATINPVSWTTRDEEAAVNDSVTVKVDQAHHVLLVRGLDAEACLIQGLEDLFPLGNLHLQELTLYQDALSKNVRDRSEAFLRGK